MNIEKTGQFIAELRREKQFTQVQLANVWMSQSPNSSKGKGSMSRYPEMS